MGRLIISEEERKSILQQHSKHKNKLNEQNAEREENIKIQKFLNAKGIKDNNGDKLAEDGSIGNYPASKSAQAIYNYQEKINVRPDGVWGEETKNKMPESDKKLFNDVNKGIIGKLMNKFF